VIEFFAPLLGFLSFWSYPLGMILIPLAAFFVIFKMSPSQEERQAYRDKAIYDAVERHKAREGL
jgi:hypothetical protein